MIRLTQIWVYPIKSCRGVQLSSAQLELRGLARDRRFMVVDETGRFLTQREQSRLALVDVALGSDSLVIRAQDASPLTLPCTPDGSRHSVRVWRSDCEAVVVPAGSRWFSEFLGQQCELVYMPQDALRPVNPERGQPGDIVSFADGYPLLLASEEALANLNQRLDSPVEMQRFRPNLVIAGAGAHAEDDWKRLTIGGIRFRNAKPCERCVVTTIDPKTGQSGKEPLASLARYRKTEAGVLFGVNLIPDSAGTLSVGMPVLPG
jgi:hypothetical protein